MSVGGGTWQDTRLCGRCRGLATYMGFRSHCRLCGASVCSGCLDPDASRDWLLLPSVRLCIGIPNTHQDRPFKSCRDCAAGARRAKAVHRQRALLVRLVPFGVHRAEWAALAKQPSSHPLCKAARQLGTRLDDICVQQEFACQGYDHDATDAALVHGDPAVQVFDMVYNTAKVRAAGPDAKVPALPLYLVLSILHRPDPEPWTVRGCLLKLKHCIPAIYEHIHHRTREKLVADKLLNEDQVQCLHMHYPDDAALPRQVPPSMQTLVEKHRSNIAVLSLMSQLSGSARADAERVSLAADFAASKSAGLLFQGRFRSIKNVRVLRPGLAQVTCEPRKLLHAYVDGVDARLVAASAFASWALYRAAFQNLARTAAGQAALLVSCPSSECPSGDCSSGKDSWTPNVHAAHVQDWLAQATEGSVFMQCQVLTVLQAVTGRSIDTTKVLPSVDSKGRLLVLQAPLLEAAAPILGQDVHSLLPRGLMDRHARAMVRRACATLFRDQREYVYWLGRILTGEDLPVPEELQDEHVFLF